jgi:PAS domain S-box-containing protein
VTFLATLFAANDFMPHGYCYLWNQGLVWTHVLSDSLIALAYLSIPVTLVYFIRKRRDVPFNWVFLCFGVFILACGATHAMEVWNLWHADYWLAGAVKVVTALASVSTAILLVPLIPRALALPSPEALRREIAERKRAQDALDHANSELERRVQQRTAELLAANEDLTAEIRQRKKTEAALRRSEEQFRLVVERVRDYAIFSLDPSGIVTSWNAGAQHIKGYHADEILGQHVSRFYVREDQESGKPERDLQLAVTEGRSQDEGWRLRKDESRFWASTVVTAIRNERGDLIGFSKITHDLTERKRAEQKLQEANATLAHMARVTTMGELTASIAHEINQPLTVIVNNANACRRILFSESPDLDEVREAVVDIADAGTRASDIITRVRALVKKSLPGKAQVSINEVIREVLGISIGELEKHIVELRTELIVGLPLVLGDRIQLQQVILNLIMNGIEAMSSVHDRPRVLLIRSQVLESGNVSVAVQDCGAGLDPGSLPHIFDTFFTTKPAGMGMGLPISRSIIEAHEGRLSARPNENFGATFEFTLPQCA